MKRRSRLLVTVAVTAAAATFGAVPAPADDGPTCSGLGGLAVHGQHVVGDYVTGLGGIGGGLAWPPAGGQVGAAVRESRGAALPGGPGPGFHFPNGFAPGASFCNSQSKSPGFHLP